MIRRMVVECDVCGEEVGANSYKIIRAKDILNCWDEPVFVFSGKYILCGDCEYRLKRITRLMKHINTKEKGKR